MGQREVVEGERNPQGPRRYPSRHARSENVTTETAENDLSRKQGHSEGIALQNLNNFLLKRKYIYIYIKLHSVVI